MDKNIDVIPEDVMAALQSYDWPGNIRELQNVIERSVILSTAPNSIWRPANWGCQSGATNCAPHARWRKRNATISSTSCGKAAA